MSRRPQRSAPRSRTGPRSRYGRSGSRSAIFWGLLTVAAVAALGGAFWFVRALEAPALDAALCPPGGPTSALVVVLDLTDPIEPAQLSSIDSRVMAAVDAAAPGAFLAVGLVHPDAARRGARFALCKPRSGAAANELYENPRMIEEQYVAKFEAPLQGALAEMVQAGIADSSPIMESIQATLAGVRGFSEARYPKTLILVTDLLQHSDVFSFYRGDAWARFAASADYERLSRNFDGATVEILRIPRPGARIRDPEAVDEFWVSYFERQGAGIVRSRVIGDL